MSQLRAHRQAGRPCGRGALGKASRRFPVLVARLPRAGGFSMVELLVVVAIIITVTAISLPTVTSVVATAQLRGGMNDLSGLFQKGRGMAVRQNTISRIRFQFTSGEWVAYVDNGVSPAGLISSAPQLWLPRQFTKVSAPSGTGGTPTALNSTTCGANSSSTLDTIDDTYFSQVGIPCQYSSGTCSGGQAFAYYFNYAARLGGTRWTGLCVSPAGRMQAWYWTGNSWTN
jgi:Tfp pilus assembly protein FimT